MGRTKWGMIGMDKKEFRHAKELPDDVAILKKLCHLSALNYVDIDRSDKLKEILEKWPLLAELHQK